jgi:hypothetical protein
MGLAVLLAENKRIKNKFNTITVRFILIDFGD